MRRVLRKSLIIGTEITFIVIMVGCYPKEIEGQRETPPRVVNVMNVVAQPMPQSVTFIGRAEPWREAILYFEVSGIVAAVDVEEGDLVKRSDPVARLMPKDYQLAVGAAEANSDAANAKLQLLLAGTRSEDVVAAKSNYDQAKIEESYWLSESDRAQTLLKKGGGSESDVSQTRRSWLAAVEATRSAKALWDRAVAGPRAEEIEIAKAESRARKQTLESAKRQLEKTTLQAPFAGRVERRLVDPGAFVNIFPTGGVPVVHLVNLDKVDAVISVPESELNQFTGQRKVNVRSVTNSGVSAVGHIVAVGQIADPESGTYPLRVRFDNPGGAFRGGMIVSATVDQVHPKDVVRVPIATVRRPYGQSPHVLLVDNGRVVVRSIKLGKMIQDQIEIVDGLFGGEMLIVGGQNLVVEGDSVNHRIATLDQALQVP
jgi:multidrug efflux pump subunit AcrA (membrane-fusion protein)